MNLKERKGITLIALVITIIVLLILAGVTIAMLTGENGILTQTKKAKTATGVAEIKERVETDVLGWQAGSNEEEINNEELKTILDKYFNKVPEVYGKDTEITAKNEYGGHTMKVSDVYDGEIEMKGYVGYYADIDDDGTVDGIIYADLAIGGSGQWGDNAGDYSYDKKDISQLKDYYISQTNYEGDFGTKDVLAGTGSGKDRFYVMALKDVALDGTSTATRNNVFWGWYYDAYDSSTKTGKLDSMMNVPRTGDGSDDFGLGRTKTQTMISKWNNEEYGTKNAGTEYKDLWGIFKDEKNTTGKVDGEKWFIPSKGEWSAFGGNLNISKISTDTNYYANLGLSDRYWSSSQWSKSGVYFMDFKYGAMNCWNLRSNWGIRLSTTF